MKKLVIVVGMITILLMIAAAFRVLTMDENTPPLIDLDLDKDEVVLERYTGEEEISGNSATQPDSMISGQRIQEMESTSDFVGGGSSSPTGSTEYNAAGTVTRARGKLEKKE